MKTFIITAVSLFFSFNILSCDYFTVNKDADVHSLMGKKSKFYEEGVSCKKCFGATSEAKKIGLRERHKQVQIAKEKNLDNPFIDVSHEDFFESGI